MANGKIEVIQDKFLKLVFLLTTRDWTNELVIVGVIVMGILDLQSSQGNHALANQIGGGLIGYLAKGLQDTKAAAKILQFPAPASDSEEPEAKTGTGG